MSERTYYVFCEDNCKFEGLNKEQIITAIAEATGKTPTNVDAAFITKIKEQNNNAPVKIWVGTQAEFNALKQKDPNTIYYYDDTDIEDLSAAIENIINGTTPVAEATHATNANHATNADYATSAGSASSATNATKATSATNATYTAFTNNTVSGGVKAGTAKLTSNGTYHIWTGGTNAADFGLVNFRGTSCCKLSMDNDYFYGLKIESSGLMGLFRMAFADTTWELDNEVILYWRKIQ